MDAMQGVARVSQKLLPFMPRLAKHQRSATQQIVSTRIKPVIGSESLNTRQLRLQKVEAVSVQAEESQQWQAPLTSARSRVALPHPFFFGFSVANAAQALRVSPPPILDIVEEATQIAVEEPSMRRHEEEWTTPSMGAFHYAQLIPAVKIESVTQELAELDGRVQLMEKVVQDLGELEMVGMNGLRERNALAYVRAQHAQKKAELEALQSAKNAIEQAQLEMRNSQNELRDLKAEGEHIEGKLTIQRTELGNAKQAYALVKDNIKTIETKIKSLQRTWAATVGYDNRAVAKSAVDVAYEQLENERTAARKKKLAINNTQSQIIYFMHLKEINGLKISYQQQKIGDLQTLLDQLGDVSSGDTVTKMARYRSMLQKLQVQLHARQEMLEKLIHCKIAGADSIARVEEHYRDKQSLEEPKLSDQEQAEFWNGMHALMSKDTDHSESALALIDQQCHQYEQLLRAKVEEENGFLNAMEERGIILSSHTCGNRYTEERIQFLLSQFRLALLSETGTRFNNLIGPSYLAQMIDWQTRLNAEIEAAYYKRKELLQDAAIAKQKIRKFSAQTKMYAKHLRPKRAWRSFKETVKTQFGRVRTKVTEARDVTAQRDSFRKQEKIVWESSRTLTDPKEAVQLKSTKLTRFGSSLSRVDDEVAEENVA